MCLHGDDRDFRVVTVFLFDDLANGIGVAVAVQYKEFNKFRSQRIRQPVGTGYPVTMRRMARVAQCTVNQFNVVLVIRQDSD